MQNKQASAVDSVQQLELAQQELAGLLYAISHDVRAPLRSIAGFTQALQEHSEAVLDETAQRYLQRIQQANQKLAAFIEALLSLSRIAHAELHLHMVDLTRLCGEVAAGLRTHYPQQSVTLELGESMSVRADPQLLQTALEHLLDNAWKATAHTDGARVAISCHDIDERDIKIITVRDNGVGFDPSYTHKLCVPFQHLHASEFAAGLGIGLATLQRIALKHGGRVWAEALSPGASFHLELPAT